MFHLHPYLPHVARAVLLALPLVVLAGCIDEETTGDSNTYAYKL